MKTPKRRITFKTPRKRQTPLVKNTARKERGIEGTRKQHSAAEKHVAKRAISESSVDSEALERVDGLIEEKEQESAKMYRTENRYLRELKSDARLFKKFTGLEISEKDEGKYVVTQSVLGRDGTKRISFELREDDDAYVYRLLDTNCTDLPSFLNEDISFECKEIHKFFFKVLEVLVAKNV